MISLYCDTDDWSSTLKNILNSNPNLNNLDVHISLNCISYEKNKKYNLLILQESPAVLEARNILKFIETEDYKKTYTKIYSCIESLQKYDCVEYIHPSNISWINTPVFFPVKTKLLSMISSNNSFLEGHKRRLAVLNQVKNFVDVYGRGFNKIDKKEEGLVDYYYSIAMENDDTNNYFSEKLIDCFLTCTIPIYWGCDYAYKIFNPNGIINLKNIQSINELKLLTKHYYYDNINAIEENYFLAKKENRYLDTTLKTILLKMYYAEHNK